MRKLLCLCLTALMFVGCCGVVACDQDDINYTAEKPMIELEYATLDDDEHTLTINGCKLLKRCKFYKDFSKYYIENLKGKGVYLLYRSNEIPPLNPYDEGYFAFFNNNGTGEIIVEESYDIYDKELGSKPNGGKDGVKSVSVYFDIFIKPIKKAVNTEIVLEFGKLETSFYSCNKFINVYSGEECFATCYFNNYVNIPQEWYENYLKTNLIYGDDL